MKRFTGLSGSLFVLFFLKININSSISVWQPWFRLRVWFTFWVLQAKHPQFLQPSAFSLPLLYLRVLKYYCDLCVFDFALYFWTIEASFRVSQMKSLPTYFSSQKGKTTSKKRGKKTMKNKPEHEDQTREATQSLWVVVLMIIQQQQQQVWGNKN